MRRAPSPRLRSRGLQSGRARLAGIAFALVFTLALVELGSMVASRAGWLSFNATPSYSLERTTGYDWRTEEDPWGAWHADHARDRHISDCYDVEYVSNNVGARDTRDYDASVPGDAIVLMGDSFAEGYGVDASATFAGRLEAATGRMVLNFGTAGNFGPVQAALLYEQLASRFPHSELVYLFLPANDFNDNSPRKMATFGARYRPYFRETEDGYEIVYPENAVRGDPYPGSSADTTLLTTAKRWLSSFTYTFNTLKTLGFLIEGGAQTGHAGYFLNHDELERAAFHFIARLLAAAGDRRKTVIVIPTEYDMERIAAGMEYRDADWYKGLHRLAGRHGARVIDLARHFPHDDYKSLYLWCDGHWSPAGHSRAVAAFLETNGAATP